MSATVKWLEPSAFVSFFSSFPFSLSLLFSFIDLFWVAAWRVINLGSVEAEDGEIACRNADRYHGNSMLSELQNSSLHRLFVLFSSSFHMELVSAESNGQRTWDGSWLWLVTSGSACGWS